MKGHDRTLTCRRTPGGVLWLLVVQQMPIAEQTWRGLGHSRHPFQKNGKQSHTQTNLISLNHTTHSQNQYLWLVLLKGQQSYFLLLALTLCTWLAELLLTRAGYSSPQATRFTSCPAVWHPSTAGPCGAETPGHPGWEPVSPPSVTQPLGALQITKCHLRPEAPKLFLTVKDPWSCASLCVHSGHHHSDMGTPSLGINPLRSSVDFSTSHAAMGHAAAAALAKTGPIFIVQFLLFTQLAQEEGGLVLNQSPGSHPT